MFILLHRFMWTWYSKIAFTFLHFNLFFDEINRINFGKLISAWFISTSYKITGWQPFTLLNDLDLMYYRDKKNHVILKTFI